MIDLVFKNSTPNPPSPRLRRASKKFTQKFFEEVLNMAAEVAKLKETGEVSINLVTEKRIRDLNKLHRGEDKPTDVLSFPLQEDNLKKYGIMPLGDIFICPSFVIKKAKEEKMDVAERMKWTVVHGFLHLLGYDHEKSDKEADKMFRLESKILKELDY